MANKIIIVILVLLVVLMGGTGYYSFTLTQQIDQLGERLTAFKTEQTARIDAISNELVDFREETLSSIDTLKEKITENLAEIESLEGEVATTRNRIAALEDEVAGVTSQVDVLEENLGSAVVEFSRSVIDASDVYQKVSQATVRISNGQNTIGSGFILDTEAHVITAYHVVESLSQIYIILYDGRIFQATNVGQDQFSDIAVLEIEENPGIQPPPLADSSRVRIGEPVAAIGSPLELRDTLNVGIVSQTNRYTEIQYDTQSRWVANLLQFDAAVNRGNSGCPLANADGEIVGIVIARLNPTEGDGINYAVAANKFKRVANELIAQGSFDYPWVGVGITDLTPLIVQERHLETGNGILVTSVFGNTPAETAGIKVNDIIVAMDGVTVRDSSDLTSYLGEFKSPGDVSTIKLLRGATEIELFIEIGKR